MNPQTIRRRARWFHMKRKLRWFEKRNATNLFLSNRGSVLFNFLHASTLVKISILGFSTVSAVSITVTSFALTIPSELRIFLDATFTAGLLIESLITATASLVFARVLLVLGILVITFLTRAFEFKLPGTLFRALYVYSLRNGFQSLLYPALTFSLAIAIFVVMSFGLLLGLFYAVAFVIVVISVVVLLVLGDVLAIVIAKRHWSMARKIDQFSEADLPSWINLALLVAIVTSSSFAFGLGISAKRHSEIVSVELAGKRISGAIVATTSFGMIVAWDNAEPPGSNYAFLPYQYIVSAPQN
jgi:hypothetical protein